MDRNVRVNEIQVAKLKADLEEEKKKRKRKEREDSSVAIAASGGGSGSSTSVSSSTVTASTKAGGSATKRKRTEHQQQQQQQQQQQGEMPFSLVAMVEGFEAKFKNLGEELASLKRQLKEKEDAMRARIRAEILEEIAKPGSGKKGKTK